MSAEPNQISFDAGIQIDGSGNAKVLTAHEYTDPYGEYATTPVFATEDTSGDGDRWSIQNTGPDLRIVGVRVSISQGSEDGRSHWNVGWDFNGQYATDSFLEDFAVPEGGNSYSRNSKEVFFPDDMRPLWEYKDTLHISNVTDTSGTGDTTKCGLQIWVIPAEDSPSDSML